MHALQALPVLEPDELFDLGCERLLYIIVNLFARFCRAEASLFVVLELELGPHYEMHDVRVDAIWPVVVQLNRSAQALRCCITTYDLNILWSTLDHIIERLIRVSTIELERPAFWLHALPLQPFVHDKVHDAAILLYQPVCERSVPPQL